MKGKSILFRLLSVLGAFCLACACTLPALAAKPQYIYTIRVFAGQQGKINGGNMITEKKAAGERVNLRDYSVTLDNDSKYYIKGFRESGKGTEEVLGVGNRLSTFLVTRDQDYVVAYGLKGDMVEYTVNFQDAQGNTLAPSETYMGNVGDRPVVAYLYIEGYQPQSYNLTKTLSSNPMENILTFVYTRIPQPSTTPSGGGTTVIPPSGPGATVITPADTPDTDEDEETEPSSALEEEELEPSSEAPVEIPENPVPEAQPEEPPELIDIDEGEVPLANAGAGFKPSQMELQSEGKLFWQNIPLWTKITAGVLVLGAIATGLWFLLFFRRDREEVSMEDEQL
ncbi:MAG: MucBP domain-containing protein [Acutalibacter sp.]|nr:MucBP domain-containing protein [Acutalibacter sp.]